MEFDGQRRLGGPSHTTEFSYLVESERSEGWRLRREITYRILDRHVNDVEPHCPEPELQARRVGSGIAEAPRHFRADVSTGQREREVNLVVRPPIGAETCPANLARRHQAPGPPCQQCVRQMGVGV